MSYPPNIEAVQLIANDILPLIEGSRLLISGATPHPVVQKLAQNSTAIQITGWVDDIRDSYCRGKIFLAPMMIGTGMQNKLLEAMALGIPCITTPLANNAIGAKHGEEILVGENTEEIVELCHTLLKDPTLRDQISTNAKKLVESKYSWEMSTKSLIKILTG